MQRSKMIFFGRVESKPMIHEDSKSEIELPQFSHYEPNVLKMIENMGYDLTSGISLNFGKGRRTLLRSFIPKGKAHNYYHRTRSGLGYVSTPTPSASESKESLYHNHSSGTSSWESDVSVSNIFKNLLVNMVSTSHTKDGDKEMIQLDTDPWIKHLNALWDICFEQREPPTEGKVTQINLRDEANSKPISISESLSLFEKDLISLAREYIDIFAWNYEDIPGLEPQVAMHRLNINPDAKPVKQRQ